MWFSGLWNMLFGAAPLWWRDLLPRLATSHRPTETTLQRQQDLRRQANQKAENWSYSKFYQIYGGKLVSYNYSLTVFYILNKNMGMDIQ